MLAHQRGYNPSYLRPTRHRRLNGDGRPSPQHFGHGAGGGPQAIEMLQGITTANTDDQMTRIGRELLEWPGHI
jgi:hypothetical protein